MTIAEDASQPAAVHATTTSATTASFSPPANSLLVALIDADGQASAAESASLSDSGSHTWVNKARANTFSSPNLGGTAEVWECQLTTAPGAITVTASWTPTTNANGGNLVVLVLTGAATDQSTAATGTSGGHLVAPTVSVTTTQTGSRVYGACLDYTTNATLSANGSTTSIDQFLDSTHGDTWATFKGSADTTTPGATTFGFTNANADYNTAAVEILPASAVTSIPWSPQRTITSFDPGEAYWTQRDRRDANAVATPANPLLSPLDSAWQAGALYWHLYAAAADNTARVWRPQQRARVSDPGLLGTAELENELLGSFDDLARHRHAGVYTDRRFVPQQRPYVSDPLLLSTAELENELLGSFDDLARHRAPAAYVDRRMVPQQRAYVSDPRLLTTGLLENELLGSADDLARHRSAAVYTDRRLVPQQRAYVSDPLLLTTALLEDALLGQADDRVRRYHAAAELADRRAVPQQRAYVSTVGLLDTAELENDLLGGADTGKRVLTPATHAPRWWMPQQPARQTVYFDAGPDVPPLTLSWGAGGHYALLYAQAGWQPDRREMPQQRAYICDPSFYPTVAATDPLTVAWGAGGTYWHLYQTAAEQVDRRLVPQQRRYLSDPALLSTALLEGALLGGADDFRRHSQVAAELADRRQAGQQRVYFDPTLLATALLESPLLGAVDDLTRHRAWFTDRGVPGWQPPRYDPRLLAPAGTPADPLLLVGGVGGDTWRRYQVSAYAYRLPAAPIQQYRWIVYVTMLPSSRDVVVALVPTPQRWSIGPAMPRWEMRTATDRWTTTNGT